MVEDQKNMTFICEEMSSTVYQKLYEQMKCRRFCDLTLYVNNKIIKAHRNVLACSSPYFDSILKHHKVVQEQLTINCLNSDIFNTLLTYMYTGRITIEHSNVQELLRLADHFIVTKVMEYCVEFLGTKLQVDNCIFTYDLTQKFKLKHLGDLVQNWISTHLSEIFEGKEILDLKENELADFLKLNLLNIPSMTALIVIAKWTYQNIGVREKHFHKLLASIHWSSIDQNEMYKHTETSLLYSKSELCLYVLLSYFLKYDLLVPNYRNKYEELHNRYAQSVSCENAKKDSSKHSDCDKISVVQNTPTDNDSQRKIKMLVIKARHKSRNQQLLRRLMLYGLKPSLRMAALKTVLCKKKRVSIVNVEKQTNVTAEDDDAVKCPVCFANVGDPYLLEQHLNLSHSKDVTYKCSVCSFVCQYQGEYMTHMKSHFSGPPFKCDYCDVSTDHISKLIAHRAKHLEDSIFQCTFCSFKCRIKQNLTTHMKIHTQNSSSYGGQSNSAPGAQEDKPHRCDQCNKSFRFRHSLDSHRASTHHGVNSASSEKLYTCDLCGFNTRFLSHMIAHKRIHSAKKTQLGGHSRSHNGVRPHSCTICGRGFMEKSHLVRHERIHLDEKPFKCSNCDYASSRRDKLKEHFTRHHGENASAKVPYKARPLRNNNVRHKSQPHESTGSVTNGLTMPNFSSTNGDNVSGSGAAGANTSAAAASSSTVNSNNIPSQPSNEIQDLIMQHHQNHSSVASGVATSIAASGNLTGINHNYHHFPGTDPGDFHHHHHHAAANMTPHQLALASSAAAAAAQRSSASAGVGGGAQHGVSSAGVSSAAAAAAVNHHMLAARGNHSSVTATSAAAVAAAMMLDPRFHHNSTVPYHSNATPVSMAMAAVQQSQHIQASSQHGEYSSSLQNCMTLF